MSLETYLKAALDLFEKDPADTDYQKGYEAALREISKLVEAGEVL